MEYKNWNIKSAAILVILAGTIIFTGCQKNGAGEKTLTLPRASYDLVKMANGAIVEARVEDSESNTNALATVSLPDAYALHLTLNFAIPTPATTLKDLCEATPELKKALPNLQTMLPEPPPEGQKITLPFYTTLFNNKIKSLQYQLSRLGQLPPRNSLYDCQTILPLTNQQTTRHAFLVQAIMNVNTDGSDGDRNIPLEKISCYYQPQTNYRWPKTSSTPNPNITDIEQQSLLWKKSLDTPTTTPEQKKKLQQQVAYAQATLKELEHWSFLIASADPFIVLPKFMLGGQNAAIGDYAVVLHQGILYPAIVGDIGPSSKIGEASLRLCRAIDPRSGAIHRPVNAPRTSYFIFPGSAEKPFTTPNYEHWSERCHQLWKELGGASNLKWHEWTKLDQPWPSEEKKVEAVPESTPATNAPVTNTPISNPPATNIPITPASNNSITNAPIPTPSATPSPTTNTPVVNSSTQEQEATMPLFPTNPVSSQILEEPQ